MLLDQRGLEDERFLLGGGKDGLDPAHMRQHDRCFRMDRSGKVGVLGKSFSQVAGLAHVQHFFFAKHLVHARPMADRGQEGCRERETFARLATVQLKA